MLYGLQDMKGDSLKVRALLRELPRLVMTCYGLHQHPPNCPQVALHDDDLEVVGVDQLISLSSQISSVNREDNTMSS